MKRLAAIFLLSLIFYTGNVNANRYAVLISAGKTEMDYVERHSEYWYDLFLAYEDLIEKGLDHDNIYVCYGDGEEFESVIDRYNVVEYHPEWPYIIDYDNDTSNIKTALGEVADLSTNNDTVVIRWVLGHGDITEYNPDSYVALIENRSLVISEDYIISCINQIEDYAQRYIAWTTCHSGCILNGNQRLDNENSVVFTSCNWDEPCITNGPGYSEPLWDNWHAVFNYWFTGYSAGHAPGSSGENEDLDADLNVDGDISVIELYKCTHDSAYCYYEPGNGRPQIGGTDLVLQDMCLLRGQAQVFSAPHYIIAAGEDYFRNTGQPTYFEIAWGIPSVERALICKTGYIQLLPGFHAEETSTFLAKIDPDLYSTSSTDLAIFGKFEPLDKSKPDKTSEDNPSEENKIKELIPTVFSCAQNSPNPFNINTMIRYGLPKDSDVSLVVFNILGQEVRTLVDTRQSAGFKSSSWDGRTSSGKEVPQGIYFYKFHAGDDFGKTYKMIVVK